MGRGWGYNLLASWNNYFIRVGENVVQRPRNYISIARIERQTLSHLVSHFLQNTGKGKWEIKVQPKKNHNNVLYMEWRTYFFHPYKIVFNISNSNVLQKRLKGLIHFLLYSALNPIMNHNNEKIPRSSNQRIGYLLPKT